MPNSFPIRQIQLNLEQGFARHWHGGSAIRSHIFNALSTTFPIGEQYFIDSVRHFLPELEAKGETALVATIRNFVGQEATHRRVHERYNQQLEKQGYSYAAQERFIQWRIDYSNRRLSPMTALTITACVEHFTAILGDTLLRNPQNLAGAEPMMAQLWRWHAVEETEHKAVAFDVYRAKNGNYLRRVLWFIYITLTLNYDMWSQVLRMLKHDGLLFKPSTWWQGAQFMFGRNGQVWQGLPQWLAFFKPNFHPNQHANQHLVDDWLAANANTYRVVSA